ncbi:MAG: MBL fold metallo-hydrolase, partial [Fimbriiglobus sp.]
MTRRWLAAFFFAISAAPAVAQDGKPATLRWYGQSFFQLETAAGRRVVFDPHEIPEFGRPIVKADVILCSHLHDDHTQVGVIENAKAARVFFGLKENKKGRPAEWNPVDEKVGPVRVRTVGLYHDATDGMQRGKNAAWVVEADGIVYCHLGDIGHELTD